MIKQSLFLLAFSAAALSSYAGAAFNFAEATKITQVPYTIDHPGNYYLAQECTYGGPAAVAITINASEVVLDLNGQTLKATGIEKSPYIGIGIAVLNQEDVTIQNGDIDGFGNSGVLFDATDNRREHNFKNQCENVRFNGDLIGVVTISGSLVDVENCFFEGGSVGIFDVSSLGGDRFQKDSFQSQTGVESFNEGIGIVATGGVGVLCEDNLFADDQTLGAFLADNDDRLRFNTFINNGAKFFGGTSAGFAERIIKVRISVIWLMGVLLISCGKAPVALVDKPVVLVDKPGTPLETKVQAAPLAFRDEPVVSTSQPVQSPSATPEETLFTNLEDTQAVQQYSQALEEVHDYVRQSVPPSGAQVFANPAAIGIYLNGLGAKLRALNQAKTQVESTLSPSDKARWNAYRKNLGQSSD